MRARVLRRQRRQVWVSSESAIKPPLVAHIIYALDTGGLENGLVNIINRCPPDRYSHVIICLSTAESFASRLTAPGVEVIELRKKPGHDLGMYWRLWRELRRLKPAIIHSRNLAALEAQIIGLLAAPRARRVHGEHGRDFNDLDGSNKKYRALRIGLAPVISRFITVSRDLAEWLQESLGISSLKITQIYNGVDSTRFVANVDSAVLQGSPANFLTPESIVVGSVGRLATVKNQKLLITAVAQLLDNQPELRPIVRCVLVGEGPEREALEQCIAQRNLKDSVWMTGDRDDVPVLLSAMNVFVLPSLNEGISNTVLEAMASGLPVVATRVGGNPELVEDGVNGILVPSNDASALAQALASILTKPERIREMGKAGRLQIENSFDWAATVAAYIKVYDEVLGVSRTGNIGGGA